MINIKAITFILLSMFLLSCSGDIEKNLTDLDKFYGYCDNPHRHFGDREYKICKDKERAQGDALEMADLNVTKLFKSDQEGSVVYQNSVNPALWSAALDITQNYALKIADNQGGYLETDWIYDQKTPDKRCLIKIRISSIELISTGVTTKLICENQLEGTWINDQITYNDEEKNLTLKILSEAQKLNS